MNRYAVAIHALAFTVSLAACGGGGGSGGPPPPPNPLPIIVAQTFNGTEDTVLTGQVVATDAGDTITFVAATNPTGGSLTNLSTAGAFTYAPNENFSGNDTFLVRVTDSRSQSVTATMTLALAPVNDPPVANNDFLAVTSADALAVLANDVDVDGDPLTVTLTSVAFAGTAAVGAGNTVNVQLPAGFKGFTKFTYRVSDPAGLTANATALAFVGIQPFKVVYLKPLTLNPTDYHGFYVNDLISEHRVHEARQDIQNVDKVKFARNGSAMAFRIAGAQINYVDLNGAAQARMVHAPLGVGETIDDFDLSADGRHVAYVHVLQNSSQIELFDARAAGPGTRISLPLAEQTVAGQPQFNETATSIYYVGLANAVGNWTSSVFRANVATRAVTRVSPVVMTGGLVLLSPVTRDDARIVYLRDATPPGGPLSRNLHVNDIAQPDASQVLTETYSTPEYAWVPFMLSPNGQYVMTNVVGSGSNNVRTVIARPASPGSSMTVGGPGFDAVGLHGPASIRADSSTALGNHCVAGICNIYEFSLNNPATLVPVATPAATDEAIGDARYSADGERITYLRQDFNGPLSELNVTHRDAFGTSIAVTPTNGTAYMYELDPSGRVAAVSVRDGSSASMVLVNVDVPLQMMTLGEDSAQYQMFAVVSR